MKRGRVLNIFELVLMRDVKGKKGRGGHEKFYPVSKR